MKENFSIKTFGILTEKLSLSQFEFPFFKDTESLLKALKTNYPILQEMNFSIAVEKRIIQGNTTLNGNEEIALLPPFSGG